MENKMKVKTKQNADNYLYENNNEIKIMTNDLSDISVPLADDLFSTDTGVSGSKETTPLAIETAEIEPAMTEIVDDLINLYDDYDIYLLNEEIVCTEPFAYENDITTDNQLSAATCPTSERIIYDEDDHSQYLIAEDDSDETDMNQQILHLTGLYCISFASIIYSVPIP